MIELEFDGIHNISGTTVTMQDGSEVHPNLRAFYFGDDSTRSMLWVTFYIPQEPGVSPLVWCAWIRVEVSNPEEYIEDATRRLAEYLDC